LRYHQGENTYQHQKGGEEKFEKKGRDVDSAKKKKIKKEKKKEKIRNGKFPPLLSYKVGGKKLSHESKK